MPDFSFIGVLLFSGLVLWYFMVPYRRQINGQRMTQAVDTLMDAIYRDLHADGLKNGLSEEHAGKVAAVTVNRVFCFNQPDDEAETFSKSNNEHVQALILKIKNDTQVRPLVSTAVRYMLSDQWQNRAKPDADLAQAVNMGLVNPTEPILTAQQFLAKVAPYHRRMLKVVED